MTADGREQFTVGVEEEFFLVAADGRLAPGAEGVLRRVEARMDEQVHRELQRYQVETGTEVCETLADVRSELVRLRQALDTAARDAGLALASSGTHPFSNQAPTEMTPKPAYLRLADQYQQVARDHLVCGCHVHVGMDDADEAIDVLNRSRPWLPTILALTANSPYWWGQDTGYASFRNQLWRRWPVSGVPDFFESRAAYDRVVSVLQVTGSIDDPARLYWDLRPSSRYPTLEFRVSDASLTVDEAVMVSGLVRALVRTCHAETLLGTALPRPPEVLLRTASWRAARYGIEGDLVDVIGGGSVAAGKVIGDFLHHLRASLEETGDWDEVSALVDRTTKLGTGAARQRQAFARAGRLEDVVDLVVAETAAL